MANEDSRSVGYQQMWSNPLFSTYGSPLSQAMTRWLYADPNSNPYANDEAQWAKAGRVAFIDRTISFVLTDSTPKIVTASLGGGKNILVFSRSANLTYTPNDSGTPFVVPNNLLNLFTCQIKRQDGFIDQETAPINNNYGTNGRPFIRPAPEFWLGTQLREFTVQSFGFEWPAAPDAITAYVSLTFQICLLDTGR